MNATIAQTSAGTTASQSHSNVATNELKKLAQHSSHYLSGILVSLALGFISFPIFTRAFSVADYGTIDLIAKVLLLLTALSKMGLQQSALRFYDSSTFSVNRTSARRYYSTMFGGVALTAAFVALLFLGGVEVAPASLINSSLKSLLLLGSVLIVVRTLTSVLWVFLRVQEKTKLYSVFTVATKSASIIAICSLMLWLGRSVFSFYSGTIVVEVAVTVILCLLLLRGGLLSLGSFDRALFWSGLAFGLPLILYELAGIILDAGDRVLVRHYLGANALGHYSVAYGMADYANNLLIVPINLALAPIYIRLWTSEGPKKTSDFLSRGLDFFLMASVGIFAIAATTSHYAIILLASSKYLGAESLIPLIVAGLLVYTSHAFLSAGLMISKNTRVMARVLTYSAGLNIVLNCFLLPRMGLKAAALATLLSYIFCVSLLGQASYKVLPVRIDVRALGKYSVAGAVAWYVGSHLELRSAIATFACRSILTVILYVGALCILDSRVRSIRTYFVGGGQSATDYEEEELAAASPTEV